MPSPVRVIAVVIGCAVLSILIVGCGSEPVVENPSVVKSGVGANPAAKSTTAPKPDAAGN